MFTPPTFDAVRCLSAALLVAPFVLTPEERGGELLEECELRTALWPQGWATQSCGFATTGLAAGRDATTVTVRHGTRGPIAVFHDGRLARVLYTPDLQRYATSAQMRTLPGACEDVRWRALGSTNDDLILARFRLLAAVRRYVRGAANADWNGPVDNPWLQAGPISVPLHEVETGAIFTRESPFDV